MKDILPKDMIFLNQRFENKEEAIRFCGEKLVEAGCVEESYIDAMVERDANLSVYMGILLLFPMALMKLKICQKSGVCVVQVPDGVNFGTDTESNIVTVLFGIAGVGDEHLQLVQQIALYCSDLDNVVTLADAQREEEIISHLTFA